MPGRVRTDREVRITRTVYFLKVMLIFFHFLIWIFGGCVVALGLWLNYKGPKYVDIDTAHQMTSQMGLCIALAGVAIALVGLMAFCCTLTGSTILLYIYSAFLSVVIVLEFSLAISVFAYRNSLKEAFKTTLQNSMRDSDSREENKEAVDDLQQAFQCCGINGYEDWQQMFHMPIPDSCCKFLKCKTSTISNINHDGCFPTVLNFINTSGTVIALSALAVAFSQLLGVMLTCCLARCLNKANGTRKCVDNTHRSSTANL